MTKWLIALPLNLLVPGTGLVMLGRPWLGLSLAGCFLVGAELGLFALLVAPALFPSALAVLALSWAAAAWLAGQILLVQRLRLLTSPDLPRQLAILRRLSAWGLHRGDYAGARSAIGLALSMDDSDPASQVLRARLLELTGSPSRARRAWRLARRLDARGEHVVEIDRHLGRSPE